MISSESIRQLQNNIDISYEDAEKILMRTGGDVYKAIDLLQKKEKSPIKRLKTSICSFLKKIISYNLLISKDDVIYVNIPILLLILIAFIVKSFSAAILATITLLLILIFELQIKIVSSKKKVKKFKNIGGQYEKTDAVANKRLFIEEEVNRHIKVEHINKSSDSQDKTRDFPAKEYYEINI